MPQILQDLHFSNGCDGKLREDRNTATTVRCGHYIQCQKMEKTRLLTPFFSTSGRSFLSATISFVSLCWHLNTSLNAQSKG